MHAFGIHVFLLYLGATRAQAYKNSWPRRTLAKAAARAGLLLFPYAKHIRLRPVRACGKTTGAAAVVRGGLQQSIAAQAAHSPVAVAVFVCVSCPPIYMYCYYYFNICFRFLKNERAHVRAYV